MAERIDDIGFGGYRLIQDTDTFCYGIDAVLLADFASRNRHKKIADLGTNNAVIPIILSSISRAEKIVGIEKQEVPFHVAERNVEMNGLSDKIEIIHTDILDIEKHFPRGSFDAVVSNPPYQAKGTGVINEADMVTVARHETSADLEAFIKCASYLLADRGAFYMIHRPARVVDISWYCRKYNLEPKYMQFISPKEGAKPNLLLVECRKNAGRELKLMDPLCVYGPDGQYTDDILKIYRRK